MDLYNGFVSTLIGPMAYGQRVLHSRRRGMEWSTKRFTFKFASDCSVIAEYAKVNLWNILEYS